MSRLRPGCGGTWGQWGGGRHITTQGACTELGCNPKHLVPVPGVQRQPRLVGEPGSGHRGLIRVPKISRTDPILLLNKVFWSEGTSAFVALWRGITCWPFGGDLSLTFHPRWKPWSCVCWSPVPSSLGFILARKRIDSLLHAGAGMSKLSPPSPPVAEA